MQRFGGLLLMLSGVVALGGYLTLPPPPDDAADLAEITRISIAPYHRERSDDGGIRTFSPASTAFREVVNSDGAKPAPTSQQPVQPWTTIVSAEPSRGAVLRSAEPGDARTRFELARDLQRELKRAGCYWGEITGAWSPATKRAMTAFMDRANATLPVGAPDYILLSLVESHSEISCSAACPSGQMMDQAGRCVPNAVIAQASKRSKRLEARRVADARGTGDPPRVAARPEQLPWLDRDGRSIVAQTVPRAAPPPGMMSIGGPSFGTPPSPTGALSQQVIIERDDGAPLDNGSNSAIGPTNPNEVAALTTVDGQANGDATASAAAPELAPPARPERRRAKRLRERPRSYGYGQVGRTRRGDPRPGTPRYNLVQVLGGIY
jgi:hypothetical protein